MARVEHFEDLEVWKLARKLTGKIYSLSRTGAFAKDFGFRDQICRAAVSIVSNIAEGFERRSNSQFMQFLCIANGSAGEVRAQLYVALDLGYISQTQFQEVFDDVVCIGKMVTSLTRHLRSPSPSHTKPSTFAKASAYARASTFTKASAYAKAPSSGGRVGGQAQPPNHLTTKPPNYLTT